MVRCQEYFETNLTVGQIKIKVCLYADDGTLFTTTTHVQNIMLSFNSTGVKCQHTNPIMGGICRHVYFKEVIDRSYVGQLLS